jgi:hypothetical protein
MSLVLKQLAAKDVLVAKLHQQQAIPPNNNSRSDDVANGTVTSDEAQKAQHEKMMIMLEPKRSSASNDTQKQDMDEDMKSEDETRVFYKDILPTSHVWCTGDEINNR